jgi:hypothetical protein
VPSKLCITARLFNAWVKESCRKTWVRRRQKRRTTARRTPHPFCFGVIARSPGHPDRDAITWSRSVSASGIVFSSVRFNLTAGTVVSSSWLYSPANWLTVYKYCHEQRQHGNGRTVSIMFALWSCMCTGTHTSTCFDFFAAPTEVPLTLICGPEGKEGAPVKLCRHGLIRMDW